VEYNETNIQLNKFKYNILWVIIFIKFLDIKILKNLSKTIN